MATIFITGITGFVGKELAKQFTFEGHSVFGSSFTAEDKQSIKLDIRNFKEVFEAFQHIQPDIVIHSAALSSVTQGRTMEYYESNVLGTENVIDALNSLGGRRRLVFLSTAGVYGNQSAEILSEELNLKPVSHYGMSKLVCERMLANIINHHDVTIVRPFNIIGAGLVSLCLNLFSILLKEKTLLD
jgi:GDP-6-deoxy-D-talose 4-dehydrogenase